jgi:hypothetical protein
VAIQSDWCAVENEHQNVDECLGRAGRNSPFLMARNKIRMMLAEERDHEKKAQSRATKPVTRANQV